MTPEHGPQTQRAAQALAAALADLSEDDTALIGVDLDRLDEQLDALRSLFPGSVRHAIAIKTMPHPRMLAHLSQQGFGLEAASREEAELALAAGAAPSEVIFDSPVKTRAEIAWCQSHLAGALLNANSLAELERYPTDPSFQVGLRINPELSTGAPSQFDVSGDRSKFGVAIGTERAIIVDACIAAGVTALHMHIGSQVPTNDPHVDAVGRILELADDIDRARSQRGDTRRIGTIDIGGGIKAETGDTEVMADYGRRLQSEHPRLFERDVRTEFGQWVHADAGWAASRVESVEERAVPMAFVHLGADYFMRDVYSSADPADHGVAVVRPDGTMADGPQTRTYDVVGPLCFAGDVLARDLDLPELDEGDWLVFSRTGANTLGLWSRHCSRAVPKVLAVRGQSHEVWSDRTAPA